MQTEQILPNQDLFDQEQDQHMPEMPEDQAFSPGMDQGFVPSPDTLPEDALAEEDDELFDNSFHVEGEPQRPFATQEGSHMPPPTQTEPFRQTSAPQHYQNEQWSGPTPNQNSGQPRSYQNESQPQPPPPYSQNGSYPSSGYRNQGQSPRNQRNQFPDDSFNFKIERHVSVIADKKSGWKREVNLVSWNGKPARFDIRDWNHEHTRMGRGVSLTAFECASLLETMKNFDFAGSGLR